MALWLRQSVRDVSRGFCCKLAPRRFQAIVGQRTQICVRWRTSSTKLSCSNSTFQFRQLATRDDNYVYIVNNMLTNECGVVDPSDAEPVLAEIDALGWCLTHVLNTHHHDDHVGGNLEIQNITGATIIGPEAEKDKIPGINETVVGGDVIDFVGLRGVVIATGGHTNGHISVHCPEGDVLFCGDTLFSLGCGRLFEGSPADMWSSLCRFEQLSDSTLILCGHEYTESNAAFCLSIETRNDSLIARANDVKRLRRQAQSTVPTTLGLERRTNVFLRAGLPSVKVALGLTPEASDLEAFTLLRRLKDTF
eukprot:m.94521 g.94521  ORF g.94521 m.94521 type:complete len:307 (+) comp26728_c0_seq1:127-1047(+)